jgi:hypothetical protein
MNSSGGSGGRLNETSLQAQEEYADAVSSAAMEKRDLERDMMAALGELPENQRAAILLRVNEGLSYREVWNRDQYHQEGRGEDCHRSDNGSQEPCDLVADKMAVMTIGPGVTCPKAMPSMKSAPKALICCS